MNTVGAEHYSAAFSPPVCRSLAEEPEHVGLTAQETADGICADSICIGRSDERSLVDR
jgi:hypothetical protein